MSLWQDNFFVDTIIFENLPNAIENYNKNYMEEAK
jgi:hypothetical protein